MKTVGVVGGMGPAATVEFLARLVRATPAARDEDHLHVVVNSDPRIPSRTAALLGGGPSPAPRLRAMARGLEQAGAEFLVMPCNTAHAFLDEMRDAVRIPILDIRREAAALVEAGPVGLLATEAVVRVGLYRDAFHARGFDTLCPSAQDQDELTALIAAVKAGAPFGRLRRRLTGVVERVGAAGAQTLVVGCTEVSLLYQATPQRPSVDALDALVAATVREARDETR